MRSLARTVFLVLFLTSCTGGFVRANGNVGESRSSGHQNPTDFGHLDDVVASQGKCFDAWGGLLNEWHANGGGLRESIGATRAQLIDDKKSRFAAIIRRIWASQSTTDGKPAPLGKWPVPDAEVRRVLQDANISIEKYLEEYIPKECIAFTWLDPLIFDELKSGNDGDSRVRRLAETPRKMKWDSTTAPTWVMYWLFLRVY